MLEEWIAAEEAAKLTGMARSTFYKAVREVSVRTKKDGRRTLFNKDDCISLNKGELKKAPAAEIQEESQETRLEIQKEEKGMAKEKFENIYGWVAVSRHAQPQDIAEALADLFKELEITDPYIRIIDVSGNESPNEYGDIAYVVASSEATTQEVEKYIETVYDTVA